MSPDRRVARIRAAVALVASIHVLSPSTLRCAAERTSVSVDADGVQVPMDELFHMCDGETSLNAAGCIAGFNINIYVSDYNITDQTAIRRARCDAADELYDCVVPHLSRCESAGAGSQLTARALESAWSYLRATVRTWADPQRQCPAGNSSEHAIAKSGSAACPEIAAAWQSCNPPAFPPPDTAATREGGPPAPASCDAQVAFVDCITPSLEQCITRDRLAHRPRVLRNEYEVVKFLVGSHCKADAADALESLRVAIGARVALTPNGLQWPETEQPVDTDAPVTTAPVTDAAVTDAPEVATPAPVVTDTPAAHHSSPDSGSYASASFSGDSAGRGGSSDPAGGAGPAQSDVASHASVALLAASVVLAFIA